MIDQTDAKGFVSRPIPNGGTYTLTSLLGVFLNRAEEMAGARDKSWTILGIEFYGDEAAGAVPHIWFPGSCGHVAIRLTENVRTNTPRAAFQLAHEVAHLISLSGANHALNLEEGFATVLAEEMAQKYFGQNFGMSQRYVQPYQDTKMLLFAQPDAIKKVRAIEPNLWKITEAHLLQVCPTLDATVADRLSHKFSA